MATMTSSEVNRKSLSAAAAASIGILLGPGPMIVGGLGLLITAISQEMGWSRTTFSMVPTFMAWTAALTAPFYGRLMDRIGLRKVMLPAIVAFGFSFLALALFTDGTVQLFAGYLFVGVTAGALGSFAYNKLVAQWFTRLRGRVIALCAAAGSGLGFALTPQYINWLIGDFGWRGAYIGTAALVLCISLPAAFFLLHDRVRPTEVNAAGVVEAHVLDGLTFQEGLRTRSFWLMGAILFIPCNAFYALLVHIVPIISDRGLGTGIAATTLSCVAIGAICGQLAASVLLDRVDTPRIALPFFVSGLIGIILVHHGMTAQTIIPGGVLIGIGQGAEMSVLAYLTSRILGLRSFGGLFGLIAATANFAVGSGPLFMGLIYDQTGSYEPAFIVFEVGLLFTFLFILLLRPYAYGGTKQPTASAVSAKPVEA